MRSEWGQSVTLIPVLWAWDLIWAVVNSPLCLLELWAWSLLPIWFIDGVDTDFDLFRLLPVLVEWWLGSGRADLVCVECLNPTEVLEVSGLFSCNIHTQTICMTTEVNTWLTQCYYIRISYWLNNQQPSNCSKYHKKIVAIEYDVEVCIITMTFRNKDTLTSKRPVLTYTGYIVTLKVMSSQHKSRWLLYNVNYLIETNKHASAIAHSGLESWALQRQISGCKVKWITYFRRQWDNDLQFPVRQRSERM